MKIAIGLICFVALASLAHARVIHVDIRATGAADGTSWADAYVDLEDALDGARKNDQIWIAEGVYKPTSDGDQLRSFVLVDGVGVYGGYTGIGNARNPRTVETVLSGDVGLETPDVDRATAEDPEVLDNSFVVIDARQVATGAVIDGIRVESCASHLAPGAGFKAAVLAGPDTRGLKLNDVMIWHTRGTAAMVLDHSMVEVTASRIEYNEGAQAGGVLALGGAAKFQRTSFFANASATSGGHLNLEGAAVVLTGCSTRFGAAHLFGGDIIAEGGALDIDRSHFTYGGFHGAPGLLGGSMALMGGARLRITNSSIDRARALRGGAIYNDASVVELVHSNLVANGVRPDGISAAGGVLATTNGGESHVANSIVSQSYTPEPLTAIESDGGGITSIRASLIEGCGGSQEGWDDRYGVDLGMNIDGYPYFLEARWRDYHLMVGSAGIDGGDPAAIPSDRMHDFDGAPRVFGEAPDMGAFELQCPASGPYFQAHVVPETINLQSGVDPIRVRLRAVEHGWFEAVQHDASFMLGSRWVRPLSVTLDREGALLEFSRDQLEKELTVGESVVLSIRYDIYRVGISGTVTDTVRVLDGTHPDRAGGDLRPDPGIGLDSQSAGVPYSRVAPNPFNPRTTIYYGTALPGNLRLTIYDLAGRRVRTLVSGMVGAGQHEAPWDGRDESGRRVASGVYLYRMVTGEFSQTKRMVLLK